MTEEEYTIFWNSLIELKAQGAFVLFFKRAKEAYIRNTLKARYNDVPEKMQLHGIEFVFI